MTDSEGGSGSGGSGWSSDENITVEEYRPVRYVVSGTAPFPLPWSSG